VVITPHDLNKRHLGQIIGSEAMKFLFCPIEKVMSTQFKQANLELSITTYFFQLVDRISGDPLWFDHPYHKRRHHILLNKTGEEVAMILSDPTWTKVVIFRDPAQRYEEMPYFAL
jgi:hypothetical protein